MKKTFLSMAALATLFLGSCTNDDIEITHYSTMQVQVQTQNLYDQLNLTTSIQNTVLGNSSVDYQIGVYTLLYNADGVLVAKDSTYSKTMGIATLTLPRVADGTYTLVTVQTMADKDNEMVAWQLVDEQKLSTLRLDDRYYRQFWYEAAGVATQQVTISEGTTVNVNPQTIGAIMQFESQGWANSGIVSLGLYIKNACDGVYLDPSRSQADRFYYEEYNASNTWSAKGYFRDTSNGIDDSDGQTLFIVETGEQQMRIAWSTAESWNDGRKFTGATDVRNINIEIGKRYNSAAILDLEADQIYSYIGEQSGYDAWLQSVQSLFAEPCIKWGATVSYVKQLMSDNGYTLSGERTLEDGQLNIWYSGKYREDEVDYYFDNSSTGLNTSVVFLNSETYGEDDVAAYLNKLGYTFLTKIDDDDIYAVNNTGTYVQVGLNDSKYWYFIYYTISTSAPRMAAPQHIRHSHGTLSTGSRPADAGHAVSLLRQVEQTVTATE